LINKLPLQIAFVLLTAMPAGARLVGPNMPVHHALYPGQKCIRNSLLAATLVDVAQTEYFPPEDLLTFDVDQVLLDRGWSGSPRTVINTSNLLWPEDLLPKKPGQKVLLIVQSDFSGPGDQYLMTVLPRAQDHLAVVTDENEALRLVESELLGQLTPDQPDRRLTALIQALLPVLTPPNVGELRPFLSHPSATVRRAALGATMTAAPDAETAQLIGKDLESFFSQGGESTEALFESYPFLDPRSRSWGSSWGDEAEAYDRICELIFSHSHLSPAALKLFTPEHPASEHL
jgi:hypothetical protein